MNHTLKDYHEECVDEGTWQPDPATDVAEWEEYELNEMDAKMNDMLYQACPFHPHHFIYCLNPQTEFASLRYKCPQESCPVYLFEVAKTERRHPSPSAGQIATRFAEVQMRMDPQDDVESPPRLKSSLAVASISQGNNPVAIFNGPLWRPRDQAQPLSRRWVKEPVPS